MFEKTFKGLVAMAAVLESIAASLRRSSGKNFSGLEIFGVLGFRGAQLVLLALTNRVDGGASGATQGIVYNLHL